MRTRSRSGWVRERIRFCSGMRAGGFCTRNGYRRLPSRSRQQLRNWGFRPSHGFISVAGVNPLAPSFDTVGILAPNADILAKVGLVLLAVARTSAGRPDTIHLIQEAFALADGDVQQALSASVRRLRDLFGERVRELSLCEFTAGEASDSCATWA